ncbi:MAG TPA: hypothetical protein VFF66_10340 [Brevundimonas sp.]|nr:hypothetical protein [Brevundimonas sp.]
MPPEIECRLGGPFVAAGVQGVSGFRKIDLVPAAPFICNLPDDGFGPGLSQGNDPTPERRLNVGERATTPSLLELARRYPALTVEVVTGDAFGDVVAEGFDAGVWCGAADPARPGHQGRRPADVADHGEPASIAELGSRNCSGLRVQAPPGKWAWSRLWETPDRRPTVRPGVKRARSGGAKTFECGEGRWLGN